MVVVVCLGGGWLLLTGRWGVGEGERGEEGERREGGDGREAMEDMGWGSRRGEADGRAAVRWGAIDGVADAGVDRQGYPPH